MSHSTTSGSLLYSRSIPRRDVMGEQRGSKRGPQGRTHFVGFLISEMVAVLGDRSVRGRECVYDGKRSKGNLQDGGGLLL